MSLIPSKRVDRIFPILPPLCLLIAAQFSPQSAAVRRWSAIALLAAIIFTIAYSAQRVAVSYREDEGALARFGAEVRGQSAANNWHYEVIGGKDEGLLLYLRKTRFVKTKEAIERWNAGAIDTLIAPEEESKALLGELLNSVPTSLRGIFTVDGTTRVYV